MGAESSILEGCEWEETSTDGLWSLTHGHLADGTEISRFAVAKNDRNHQNILRNLIKNLRTIRHPSVLSYACSEEGSSGPQLVTEKALPLETVLPSLSSTEICAGLHTVLEVLQFLHENVGASHNNMHIGAVYVTADGSWRLGGLEHLCKFSEVTDTFLESSKAYRHESTFAPEEKGGKICTDTSLGHARDIYAFAVMTESLLEHMQDLGDLTKTFELRIQDECLHSDPRNRPKACSLLTDRLFNTAFLEIALFLKNITLKSEEERTTFFRKLLPMLRSLPEELVARRLVPGLLSRFVFMDQAAVENVLPSLLTPRKDESHPREEIQPLFSEKLFKMYVVPKLVKILSVHDYHIHILLLQYFPYFVHLIDKEDLEFDVFPQVLLGLRDCSEQIASLSLHALAEMVPVLGRDVVIGGKSKNYFKEGRPKTHNHDVSPALNNKQSNVHGVFGKMKLIDLVKQSKSITSEKKNDDASDRKWKEKEQRREEMRRRREERKLSREKAKKMHKEEVEETVSEVAAETSVSLQSVKTPDIIHTTDERIGKLSDIIKDSTNSDGSTTNCNLEEDAVVETAGWSGWSEEEGHSDFSEEIERELANMDSSLSPSKNDHPKISTHSEGNTMNIVTDQHLQALSVNGNKFDGDELAKVTKHVTLSSKGNNYAKSQKKLGAEFDIMDLDIKVSKKNEDPLDFFADMAPKIETTKAISLNNLADGDVRSNARSTEVKQLSLEVKETDTVDVDDGGGWAEDDW
ncbi:protein-associating with the carboxyl-terminal domain of ezrin-like isoform X2 [Mercenaria mercenaria]|uniref:protein-associating with the carboxyl-terminal domain of ezrin-like isoform X2 n=1 Tax=Mercenaria mercenaria TaxID=6596 RepID=UPI00234E97A0|nr:protein-associating with the carboxyl-terminal domain of ezrin-like isoform X2 [Mercenaria mercenaria]